MKFLTIFKTIGLWFLSLFVKQQQQEEPRNEEDEEVMAVKEQLSKALECLDNCEKLSIDGLTILVNNVHMENGGVDTSDATASSMDILYGKSAYVDGVKVEGSILTRTSCFTSGHMVYVNEGYYPSTVLASVSCVELGHISVSTWLDGGHISITFYQEPGYCEGGERIASYMLPLYSASMIYPGVSDQYIPKHTLTMASCTILGDRNLKPENIREGIEIFGVKGTYKG